MNTSPGPAFKHTSEIDAVIQADTPRDNNPSLKAQQASTLWVYYAIITH